MTEADVQQLLAEKKIRAVAPDPETARAEIDVARRTGGGSRTRPRDRDCWAAGDKLDVYTVAADGSGRRRRTSGDTFATPGGFLAWQPKRLHDLVGS